MQTSIHPVKIGSVPSPLVGEALGVGYFRINTIFILYKK